MHLQNFKKSEFREWWPQMSPRLLTLLDVLRYRLNVPITISASPQALGRNLGPDAQTAHNVDKWGAVLAVDCFVAGVDDQPAANFVLKTAIELGFTGIGFYPDWTNNQDQIQSGWHFDVRPNRKMGSPATWGKVNGEWCSIEHAILTLKD